MHIEGLQKLTLLDYPGKVAATVFFGGCNFRCPFCHNGTLVTDPEGNVSIHELMGFLGKRAGILDGVCITGGEPLLQPELPHILHQIKTLGYAIKLDTNGSFPVILKKLVADGLVDTVAMDIKNSQKFYGETAGKPKIDMDSIEKSVEFLLSDTVDYEFRTTVVAEYHTKERFAEIAQWIAGAKAYYLQGFVDSGDLLCPGLHPVPPNQMEEFRQICLKTIPNTQLRGVVSDER